MLLLSVLFGMQRKTYELQLDLLCIASMQWLRLRDIYILAALLHSFRGTVQAAGALPAGLPGGQPGAGPSAPSGPASYPTMLAPKHPDAQKDADAQPGGSSSQAQSANGHAKEVRAAHLPFSRP